MLRFGVYGLGTLVLALEVACAVHAVRRGRQHWLWLILAFPVVGPLIYVAVEVQPPRSWPRLLAGLHFAVSPARRLAELRARVEESGTVENRAALAEECVAQGLHDEAITLYRGCLSGVFKDDPKLLRDYAAAHLAKGAFPEAEAILEHVFEIAPRQRTPESRVLLGRALEGQGKDDAALEEYRFALPAALGAEARCRCAMLLARLGRKDEARPIFERIVKDARRSPAHYRRAQREWIERAKRALKA